MEPHNKFIPSFSDWHLKRKCRRYSLNNAFFLSGHMFEGGRKLVEKWSCASISLKTSVDFFRDYPVFSFITFLTNSRAASSAGTVGWRCYEDAILRKPVYHYHDRSVVPTFGKADFP
jgi:hypothetical protein